MLMKVVIVSGISGINKSNFVNKFIQKAKIGAVSEVIEFEHKLVDSERGGSGVSTPTTITAFLNQYSQTDKVKILEETFGWIKKSIGSDKKYIFLNIHLMYYKNSEYFPPSNPSHYSGLINSIRSDVEADDVEVVIINLIDDVFNIWKSISDKDIHYPDTKLTLREILGWRSLEALQADSLSNVLHVEAGETGKRVRSYMVSVRHPISTFQNLILPKTPLCIYLSYPISKTRTDKSMIEEINVFRLKMHKIGKKYDVAIFDPVTIDELYPNFNTAASDSFIIDENMRWPLAHRTLARNMPYPIKIPSQEIAESKLQIRHQIRSRDFKLIDSSSVLAVYRPYLGGQSTGVMAEIGYATTSGKNVVIYSPLDDARPDGSHPFDSNVETIGDVGKYYRRIAAIVKDLKGDIRT